MKLRTNQSGIAHVAAILAVVVIVAIAVVGWKVWDNNKDNSKSDSTNQQASQSTAQEDTNSKVPSTAQYLKITEWGVKLKNVEAIKMSYQYKDVAGEDLDGNKYDSSITPVIKPENLQDKTCGLGVGMHRSATKPESAPQAVKVGSYYFWSTGGPGPCGNDADDKLKGDILNDFKEKNLMAL